MALFTLSNSAALTQRLTKTPHLPFQATAIAIDLMQLLAANSKSSICLQRLFYSSTPSDEKSYMEAVSELHFKDPNPSKTLIDARYKGLMGPKLSLLEKKVKANESGNVIRRSIRRFQRNIRVIYLYREWDLSDLPEVDHKKKQHDSDADEPQQKPEVE